MTEALFIGLDLGGTEVKSGLGSADGSLCWTERTPSEAHLGKDAILQALEAAVRAALDEARNRGAQVRGIGLGTPGVVDPTDGVILYPVANLGGWHGTDLKGFFADRFNLPAVIDNDANAAAWGEYISGAGRGARVMLMVTVGTGIGGGAVISGELVRGASGGALEVGHTLFEASGRPCNCGLTGCMEAYAGGWGMVSDWRERLASDRHEAVAGKKEEELTVTDLIAAGLSDDPLANEVLDDGARALGAGLMSAIHLINPDVVVIGGGVIDARPRHLQLLEETLREKVLPKALARLEIVRATHGNQAGVIGAVALAAAGEG
ncbi:MAG TPA: ROK family protein [Planctomycetes bacterium]|nr:ROK family protein [Planctomycetota bacterium]HIN81270.1 ROK family protein [Planctomycetota bacterium]